MELKIKHMGNSVGFEISGIIDKQGAELLEKSFGELNISDLKELVTKGNLQLKDFRPALKLDWANFQEHVVLDKKTKGFVQRILFTPDDLEAFQRAFKEAFEQFERGR